MTQTRSLLSDGAWLAFFQGMASLGHLAGLRVLTGILPPAVFGELSLWLGVVALLASGLANPTLQAMLRHYPEYALRGQGALVRSVTRQQLQKLVLWTLPVFVLAAAAALFLGRADASTLVLLVALVVVEITRTQGLGLLNATRSHRAFGSWLVLEACGRPLVAWSLVMLSGVSTTMVLSGYLVASVLAWAVMRRFVPREPAVDATDGECEELGRRFWRYSLPLLPLGLIGWVTGMGDRYIIGALLTPADVGLYVAVYGLASRPMFMLGALLESTFRPVYQSALAAGDEQGSRNHLQKWAILVALGSGAAFVLAWAGHGVVAGLLLGKEYRSVSSLFPWIVGGHAFLLLSHVASRVCYALDATRSVLLVEGVGAVVAVVVGVASIRLAGLKGAAIAVVIYFSVQLALSYWLARRLLLTPRPFTVKEPKLQET